jgi:hypothetical protein
MNDKKYTFSQAYDYGKERNLKEYGQEEPIDFFDHYDKYNKSLCV